MSDSPQSQPKDVEQGAPSPDEDAQMNDPQDPQSSSLGYEFEVKEQDRWLPIANGMSYAPISSLMIRVRLSWFSLRKLALAERTGDPLPQALLLVCL